LCNFFSYIFFDGFQFGILHIFRIVRKFIIQKQPKENHRAVKPNAKLAELEKELKILRGLLRR